MTPSNPDNNQPLIYRIMDALGVTHLVACLNHTHDQSEVEGLTAALAGKLAKLTSFTADNFVKVKSDGTLEDSGKKASDFADAAATATALAGKQATLTFDSTPTAGSTNPVTSGGVKAAIDALLTNYIPIHQVTAILPKTSNQQSPYDAQSWLGNGKMAFVLQTSRPVRVYVDARGYNDAPDSTGRTESTDIYFDIQQGVRTVKNLYDLMSAALRSDYPDFNFTGIDQWKIAVRSLDTETDNTMCVINVYNPTSSE